jgi:hypothetical protein
MGTRRTPSPHRRYGADIIKKNDIQQLFLDRTAGFGSKTTGLPLKMRVISQNRSDWELILMVATERALTDCPWAGLIGMKRRPWHVS